MRVTVLPKNKQELCLVDSVSGHEHDVTFQRSMSSRRSGDMVIISVQIDLAENPVMIRDKETLDSYNDAMDQVVSWLDQGIEVVVFDGTRLF